MDEEIQVKIEPKEIKKGDFIYFKVEPWFAEKEGIARIFKDKNDGIDQGFVSFTNEKSVFLSFCSIHERRDKWIPRSVFMWVFVVKNRMKRDWVQESAEADKVKNED